MLAYMHLDVLDNMLILHGCLCVHTQHESGGFFPLFGNQKFTGKCVCLCGTVAKVLPGDLQVKLSVYAIFSEKTCVGSVLFLLSPQGRTTFFAKTFFYPWLCQRVF